MMMERAKTAPAPETTNEKAMAPISTAPANKDASAEERVQDLERRLNLLDSGDGGASAPAAPVVAPAITKPTAPAQTGNVNPLLKRIQAAQERARLAEQKEKESKAAAAAELQRQQLEAEVARLRAAEQERIAKAQSALRSVAGRALEDKQKDILAQLEGKSAPPPPPPTMAVQTPPPPAAAAVAPPSNAMVTPGVPIMKSLDPPPPSFDSMKFPPPNMQQQVPGHDGMIGHGMNSRVLSQQSQQQSKQAPPPSFDVFEQHANTSTAPPPTMVQDFLAAPPAPTAPAMSPSAPPITMEPDDRLQGIRPVAPPPPPFDPMLQTTPHDAMPPPPSFAEFEQQAPPPTTDTMQSDNQAVDDEGVFDYDENGNPMSLEQRQALLDEQRQLYDSIMKEKAANDAAIARANADAFDNRSSNAAARAMDGGSTSSTSAALNTLNTQMQHVQAMDSAGMDAAAGTVGAASASASAGQAEEHGERRMVKIGANQMVALHGQDRTKQAIKEGTAILVQCMNCQNWMQVTDTATLMFCPVCQVVSPVIQQNEVMTKEEAIQLTMDRKLAEKLQQEAYDDGEAEEGTGTGEEPGFFSSLFGGGGGEAAAAASTTAATSSAAAASSGAAAQSDSWWNKISSVVSYGMAEEQDRGELGVTRPPGTAAMSEYPANRARSSPVSATANINDGASPTHQEETRGLLSPVVVDGGTDNNTANLPSGRVAEQKPLFSCMMDSVSNAANAVWSTGEGENVHGVDGGSLLITNAGRGVGDGAGDYSKLPDQA